ncbi:Txe/YoeB family addiction module toxin [Methanimicrococcus sp. OttesenSCG-928-J09]|nr:Txe/YoeB family addiction module toxin [Methanimicrococcus sp. OttesenSCG-928-J09]
MKVIFSEKGWDEYLELQKNNEKQMLQKINELIKEIQRKGISNGIGHPEPLKHQYSGCWSRRITQKHRLIYKLDESQNVIIISCQDHYD